MEENKIEYVLNGIRDMWPDFPINEHKLNNPNFDLVKLFYVHFLDDFYTVMNETCENRFNLIYPPINDWSIENITLLFLRVKEIVKSLDCNSNCFTLNDLVRPTKARTITMFQISLSLLFTLKKLEEPTKLVISELFKTQDVYESLKDQNKELEAENAILTQENGALLVELDNAKEEEMHLKQQLKKHEERKFFFCYIYYLFIVHFLLT